MIRARPKQILATQTQTIVLMVVMFVISCVLWMVSSAWTPWRTDELRVWMLDVGQGDAFFIEFPTGEQWLIDAGRDDGVLAKLGSVLPPWDRSLDAIVMTHPDADHISGFISVLDRYDVTVIYETGARAHTAVDRRLLEQMSAEGAQRQYVQAGDVFVVGDVTLTVVWPQESFVDRYPDNRNDHSIVFLLEYGQTSILFTGDAEIESEMVLGSQIGDIDVLKVGHHGSLTSTSWEFLQETTPEMALISSGRENAYGHPHPIVVSRLEAVGAQIFRTDIQGDVLVTSQGGEPTVRAHPLPY